MTDARAATTTVGDATRRYQDALIDTLAIVYGWWDVSLRDLDQESRNTLRVGGWVIEEMLATAGMDPAEIDARRTLAFEAIFFGGKS